MTRTFVDTDVFTRLDENSQPARTEAARTLFVDTTRAFTTNALVLAQLYSSLARRNVGGSPDRLVERLARLAVSRARHFATIDVTPAHVSTALELVAERQMQLWDAVNWATAIAAGCDEYASFDAPGLPHTIRGVRYVDPLALKHRAT